jgi:UPF0271 protein
MIVFDPALPVVTLPDSALSRLAGERGVTVVAEGFADRNYAPDGSLVPRADPRALLHDPAVIARRATDLVLSASVTAIDGTVVPMTIRTICVHGDTPGAVSVARAVRTALVEAGCELRSFR